MRRTLTNTILAPLLVLTGASTVSLALAGCGGTVDLGGAHESALSNDEDAPLQPTSKIDLLFVVDDSSSMLDKQALLSTSAARFLNQIGDARDLHVGVIGSTIPSAQESDTCAFMSYGEGMLHGSATTPSGVFLSPAGDAQRAQFVVDVASTIRDVGQAGCGLEATLEAAYQFLVQPDPSYRVVTRDNTARYEDVNLTILKERAAFLRPDSLVLVVLLTDEDDASVDAASLGGQGWVFLSMSFPGSMQMRSDGRGSTAPRATSACSTDPSSADCTSCGLAAGCDPSTEACRRLKADPNCQINGGYYTEDEDDMNVRMHRMKERFGLEPRFPTHRYVDGFSRARVPSRAFEHATPSTDSPSGYSPYAAPGTGDCTNPLFAASLPQGSGDEFCNLPRGGRSRELVLFAAIGGMNPELLKNGVTDWPRVLGQDPDNDNYAGIDPHMYPSTRPRAGLPAPSNVPGDVGPDPVHGREWNTNDHDLQYACTFALPVPMTCTTSSSCDCNPDVNPPICSENPNEQVRAKAYPSIRPLTVARDLGNRGIVGSICTDIQIAYDSVLAAVAQRIEPLLL